METVISYQSLLEKFEVTKKELGEAEETIRRITGREPDQFANNVTGVVKWKNQVTPAAGRPFPGRKRPLFPIGKMKDEESVPVDEESPDEEGSPEKKPALQSTVVATAKDIRSRKDTIQEQNINSKVAARNRRMLGMILGTLQKFQHEESKRKQQDLKRAEIEQKVEAAAEEEKERIKREKEDLLNTRREKQTQLRCLEKKLEIAEVHETWENNHKGMLNFILTKANPPIFFLPSSHNASSKKCLEESRTKMSELIQQHREKMEKELQEVEEWYKKDNFPGDKENIGPQEEGESEEMPGNMQERPITDGENANIAVDDEDRTNDKNLENLTDQDFEPIYD